MSFLSVAPLPLVGRSAELGTLQTALDDAAAGKGRMLFLCGESGVGKTRLVKSTIEAATRRGWMVASGNAYAVETGVPYAPFADAFVPILRSLDPALLSLLTRGSASDLARLFPAMTDAPSDRPSGAENPAELKARLLWTFTQFLSRLAARQPVLITIENLQWADASSIELLHFIARRITSDRIVVLCTYVEGERDAHPTLRTTEQSLVSLGAVSVHRIEPLTRPSVDQLLGKLFETESSVAREFAALLYGWTRGNPFFLEETLKSLIDSGRLYQREGTWLGWEVTDIGLPRSIREAVVARMARLSPSARALADLCAVVGVRVSLEALRSISELPDTALVAAIEELRAARVLVETAEGDEVMYDFAHPMLSDTLYRDIGLARARILHADVAERLERFYGEHTAAHTGELAFHFARGDARGSVAKAVAYLSAAGRSALATYSNREAADYLGAALDLLERADGTSQGDATSSAIVEDLAQARQRLGDYNGAMALWRRARADAVTANNLSRLAAVDRRMGLASYWSGRYQDALAHYDNGLESALSGGDDAIAMKLLLAKGMTLHQLGMPAAAQAEVERALGIAERTGDAALLARAHRALLLLYMWTGSPRLAREHGVQAIALATESQQKLIACTAHWSLAILSGLTGNAAETAEHIGAAEHLADELHSPVLRLWIAEVAIEYASITGDWEAGIALAESTIAVARALQQRALLPRLLVWTAIIYFGRGDIERGKQYVDEAWALSGAAHASTGGRVDVHSVIPAHVGQMYYHLSTFDLPEAIRVGEAGLAIADASGYVVWVVHRLLPVLTECVLRAGDLERGERLGKRLRVESERMGHLLGLAWADAADGIVRMLHGETEQSIALLRNAVAALERVPFVMDASRLRRELSRRLVAVGDREGALSELRLAHDVFARLGAERELSGTRDEIRGLGARPPLRGGSPGTAGLTAREIEIARLIASRKSNKEIGRALGISPRTVSTHLSNIFEKVGVGSRGELADFAREEGV